MEDKKKSHLRRDLLLVAVILIIAAAGLLYNQFQNREPAEVLEISIDGKVIETLDLSKDTELTITGYNNGTNHLIIRGGEAWIDDASCPDKVCIHQGKISQNADMIVCLPNLMIAQVRSNEES